MCNQQYWGWANYETWAVHAWLVTSRSAKHWNQTSKLYQARATETEPVRRGHWSPSAQATFDLAESLRQQFACAVEHLGTSQLMRCLLASALHRVDWEEVAEALLRVPANCRSSYRGPWPCDLGGQAS